MEIFARIVPDFKPLTVFAIRSILDVDRSLNKSLQYIATNASNHFESKTTNFVVFIKNSEIKRSSLFYKELYPEDFVLKSCF